MDQAKRQKLVAVIRNQPDDDNGPPPVVSIEEFFEGNDDLGSIGCNLLEHPGIDVFYEHLRAIRDRSQVQDVLVEIYEVEEADVTMWPFSERIYVFAAAELQAISEWLAPLQPDEVEEGWFQGVPERAPQLSPGMRVVSAWWD